MSALSLVALLTNDTVFANDTIFTSKDPVARRPRFKELSLDYMYTQDEVNFLCIRIAAIVLYIVVLRVWVRVFRNHRKTILAWLVLASILAFFMGVIVQFLPYIGAVEYDGLRSKAFGVGGYLLSTEIYNWVLFIRFTNVTPMQDRLNTVVKAVLCLESIVVFANWIIWLLPYYPTGINNTQLGVDIYGYVAAFQTLFSLAISTHFIFTFYIPIIQFSKGSSWWMKALSSGLLYLLLESVLHMAYTITNSLRASMQMLSSVSNLTQAVRFWLFLAFLENLRTVVNVEKNSITERLNLSDWSGKKSNGSSV
ncbi:hypothetical protein BKA69DRAFT_1122427 [Paraphysoderma sedebokerense]|nr:hypothetical protein BKA69DRAFT_1122427 [Paraphysoderma sedebokerense]